jgi:hypothetical protein
MSDAEPLAETAFAHELRVLNSSRPCPWRSGHAYRVAEKENLGLDPFQGCLLCLLGEILRELEVKRRDRW